MGVQVSLRQGSLTDGDEDVLVNASNTGVMLGSGVSAAIRAACGAGYQEHIASLLRERFGGPMKPGDVLVTDAGRATRARFVAHVAVMDYRPGSPEGAPPTLDRIRTGCRNLWRAIDAIDTDGPLSVAMVALGAGVGGLGVTDPVEIAYDTLFEEDRAKIGHVVFYGYAPHEFRAIEEVVRKRHGHAGEHR